jgi:hypothetical protein
MNVTAKLFFSLGGNFVRFDVVGFGCVTSLLDQRSKHSTWRYKSVAGMLNCSVIKQKNIAMAPWDGSFLLVKYLEAS